MLSSLLCLHLALSVATEQVFYQFLWGAPAGWTWRLQSSEKHLSLSVLEVIIPFQVCLGRHQVEKVPHGSGAAWDPVRMLC